MPEPFLKGSTANTMHCVVALEQREGRKGKLRQPVKPFSNMSGDKTSNRSLKDSMLQKKKKIYLPGWHAPESTNLYPN